MNHDDLHKLYLTDPEEFDRQTRQMIDDYINSLPEERQQRARQHQWKIDQTLSHYKDPVARMNKMVEMLWSGVDKFQKVLSNPKVVAQKSATIKPFKDVDPTP